MTQATPQHDARAHVRKRPGMYFGDNASRGVVHAINELISNGLDLYLQGKATWIGVSVDDDGIEYTDDGPGLPFDVPGPSGTSLAEHYLTHYHDTATADQHAPHVHLLSHGLGLMIVNAVSASFEVKSWRSGSLWVQRFGEGLPAGPAQIEEEGAGRGTSIKLRLDDRVFSDTAPDFWMLRRLMFEAAHLVAGVTLGLGKERFFSQNGLADLASLYHAPPPGYMNPTPFSLCTSQNGMRVNLGLVGEADSETLFRSWANGSLTSYHGTHVDGLKDALRYAEYKPAVAMIHVVMEHAEFAGPTRGRLSNREARKCVRDCVRLPLLHWREGIAARRGGRP